MPRLLRLIRLVVVIFFAGLLTHPTFAQESKAAPAADQKAENPPAAKEPAAETPKADSAKADDASAAAAAGESFLTYCFRASPTFFILMLGISVWLVTLIVQAFLRLKSKDFAPPALMTQIDGLLNEKRYREAYEVVKNDKSLLGRSLAVGVERLSYGVDKGMEGMFGTIEDGKMELEHQVSPIALVGTIGPLLGLLGTVLGMILTFQEIGRGGQPKPAQLAETIGLALVSTLEGLIVAIPAVFFFSMIRNRIARLIFDCESYGETYLLKFAQAVKK